MKCCVLIPTYNNVSTIGPLVRSCAIFGLPVIVVDDGSRDGSGATARNEGATVLTHPKTSGKGAALQTGFDFIRKTHPEIDFVVTMDADGQHDPADIPQLLGVAKSGNSLVIGRRQKDINEMPMMRRIGNDLISRFISALLRERIFDTQSGFRAFPIRLVSEKRFLQKRYAIETEMLFCAQENGLKIVEVPTKTIYFNKTQLNFSKDLPNVLNIVGTSLRALLRRPHSHARSTLPESAIKSN